MWQTKIKKIRRDRERERKTEKERERQRKTEKEREREFIKLRAYPARNISHAKIIINSYKTLGKKGLFSIRVFIQQDQDLPELFKLKKETFGLSKYDNLCGKLLLRKQLENSLEFIHKGHFYHFNL